jgi:hypothetical protein
LSVGRAGESQARDQRAPQGQQPPMSQLHRAAIRFAPPLHEPQGRKHQLARLPPHHQVQYHRYNDKRRPGEQHWREKTHGAIDGAGWREKSNPTVVRFMISDF